MAATAFDYGKWLKNLRESDQKALTAYFEGEVPELDDFKLLVKAELLESMKKPLTVNRIWKAIQDMKKSSKEESKTENVEKYEAEIASLKMQLSEKESKIQNMQNVVQQYLMMEKKSKEIKSKAKVSSADALPTILGATNNEVPVVWLPSKAVPPNIHEEAKKKKSRFWRPDRASAHV
mmetsp:Transcript_16952/g.25441  ORF Transcript_16952/g.25441 Transcript_16952/m.25441 type:complete len:178 (-) Transcript_16952:159-692(-)|eukprot:CAMPEP_0167761284 /NCGR_PEP_ID=MMETSP0110_2-20121227/12082_1 /TAXON_ID=629695 /ORGANISM="Gymnochlora sp., Strain CCMP2014" /LENGTH=177 /DNA_ID=CAMNT_0007647941 /DNA_START=295 /DNA_END=828 /DNA_ORIENTATION=-